MPFAPVELMEAITRRYAPSTNSQRGIHSMPDKNLKKRKKRKNIFTNSFIQKVSGMNADSEFASEMIFSYFLNFHSHQLHSQGRPERPCNHPGTRCGRKVTLAPQKVMRSQFLYC